MEENVIYTTAGVKVNLYNTVEDITRNLKVDLPYDLAILLLKIYKMRWNQCMRELFIHSCLLQLSPQEQRYGINPNAQKWIKQIKKVWWAQHNGSID